jgi:uncharacterized membrane protein YeaQ/YmgE (transglycosylase-associated protein family)
MSNRTRALWALDIASKVALGLLVASLGAYVALLWEVAEYWAFIRTSPELQTAYTDTLGDMVLGSLGSTLAGVILAMRHVTGTKDHRTLEA